MNTTDECGWEDGEFFCYCCCCFCCCCSCCPSLEEPKLLLLLVVVQFAYMQFPVLEFLKALLHCKISIYISDEEFCYAHSCL